MNSKSYKILIATNHLHTLGGSETFTYALIEELRRSTEYFIEYFTFRKGIVSDKIESELGVQFMSLKSYDLILANHNTCVNELYKKGFVIQTCHGIFHQLEQPSEKADAFVSISQEVQDHLAEKGFPSKIILNGINLNRFYPKNEISQKLTNVLSLCQSNEANTLLEVCCKELGLKFYKMNKFEDSVWEMEEIINRVDLVIGLGRSAYEAMACGRPVIIFDNRPYFESVGDGYARELLGLSLQNNCSGRYSKKTFEKESLIREFKKYNYEDSTYFRNFALKEINIEYQVNKYLHYYKLLIERNSKLNKQSLSLLIKKVYKFL
jgi:glycosyltransferase involved in cell wall biosynthesis